MKKHNAEKKSKVINVESFLFAPPPPPAALVVCQPFLSAKESFIVQKGITITT